MVTNPSPVICEGVLDKRCDRKLLGPGWKSRYCHLTSDALVMYRNRGKRATTKGRPIRTLPLCHMRSVTKHQSSDPTIKASIFEVATEQGESLMFRCKDGVGWPAQIQIQLIHYKNRQDILRYKQLNSSMAVAENVIQRAQNRQENKILDPKITRRICPNRGYRTVVLPNHKHNEMGIGITVIMEDERIIVNRILEGGPAERLGVLKPKDELVMVNSVAVKSVENLKQIVQASPDSVTFVVKPHVPKPPSPKDEIEYKNDMKKYINYQSCEIENDDCVFNFL